MVPIYMPYSASVLLKKPSAIEQLQKDDKETFNIPLPAVLLIVAIVVLVAVWICRWSIDTEKSEDSAFKQLSDEDYAVDPILIEDYGNESRRPAYEVEYYSTFVDFEPVSTESIFTFSDEGKSGNLQRGSLGQNYQACPQRTFCSQVAPI